jgi:hypothetical protein
MLIEKYKYPCDENCTFLSFNYDTYYSTCKCQIKSDEKTIKDKLIEEVKDNEYIKIILETNNYKYFLCYKIFFQFYKYIKGKIIWPIIISFALIIIQFICFTHYICKNKKKINFNKNEKSKENNHKKEINIDNSNNSDNSHRIFNNTVVYGKNCQKTLIDSNNNESNDKSISQGKSRMKKSRIIFSITTDSDDINNKAKMNKNFKIKKIKKEKNNKSIVDYSKMDFDCAKEKDERNCCYIIWSNIRKNFCNSIYIKEYDKNLWSYYIYIFAILLHIYIFVNTLLFSVNNFKAY